MDRGSDGNSPSLGRTWIRAGVIVLGAAALGWFASVQAFATAMAQFNPELAFAAAPGNGEAAAHEAEFLLTRATLANNGQPTHDEARDALAIARASFARSPLEVIAVRSAGMARDALGDTKIARALMREAIGLSARDTGANLWLVNDYAKLDDLSGVLHHYDLALRTSSKAEDVLLPKLAQTLQLPQFIGPIEKQLAQNPPWATHFWYTVINTPDSLKNAATLRMDLYKAGVAMPQDRLDRMLVNGLARNNEWNEAFTLYRQFAGKSAPPLDRVGSVDLSRDPQFPPVEWAFPTNGLQSGGIDPGTRQMILTGGSGSVGIGAYRALRLKPGRYAFDMAFVPDPTGGQRPNVEARVVCATSDSSSPVADFKDTGQPTVSGSFTITGACSDYLLQLRLSVQSGGATDVAINKLSLQPS
ncbi:hypothetical protein [Tsuneonella mangrovi]|uniref:hypothetical protein n=1 Tax=Tsuneonella mangrovi TaxID=1982042 RepID=UPI000BA20276|nr:hypothetical protein [Tsuneonella mangrovi]